MKKLSFTLFVALISTSLMLNSCKKDDNNTTVPVLTTTVVSSITQTTAISGGNISSDGGSTVTARGVCYSITTNPTIAQNITTNGTGAGSFTSNLIDLTIGTTYYVRAYATNSVGTAYGNEVSFTTQQISLPSVNFNGDTLYIHPSDNASAIGWGGINETGATDTENGRANTSKIVDELGPGQYAAYLCDTLTAFGYSDWYLPSKDELNALYLNKQSIGGFKSSDYWSSTEYENMFTAAWSQNFQNGNQESAYKQYLQYPIRCIRKD